MTLNVDWIDASLIECFLMSSAVNAVNRELESVGKLPLVTKLTGFAIELNVAGKAKFSLQLVERDFEPNEPTLVMRLLEI